MKIISCAALVAASLLVSLSLSACSSAPDTESAGVTDDTEEALVAVPASADTERLVRVHEWKVYGGASGYEARGYDAAHHRVIAYRFVPLTSAEGKKVGVDIVRTFPSPGTLRVAFESRTAAKIVSSDLGDVTPLDRLHVDASALTGDDKQAYANCFADFWNLVAGCGAVVAGSIVTCPSGPWTCAAELGVSSAWCISAVSQWVGDGCGGSPSNCDPNEGCVCSDCP